MENKKIEKRDEVENHSKKIVALALALVLLIGGTYAWLTLTLNGNKTTRLEAGTLSLEIKDEANAINIEDAFPMTDEEGKATEPYTFILMNNGTIVSDYSIFLDNDTLPDPEQGESPYIQMKEHRIKYRIEKTVKTKVGDTINQNSDPTKETDDITKILNPLNTDVTPPENPEIGTNPEHNLDSGTLEANDYIVYKLRLWIDHAATAEEMENTAYAAKLRVEASQQGIEE